MKFTIYQTKNGFTVKAKDCSGIFIASDTYAIGKIITDFIAKNEEIKEKLAEIHTIRNEVNC